MKKVYLVSMLLLGTIIGAGFCSGKEICVYFAKFGIYSLFFLPILFGIYFLIFKLFLSLGSKKQYNNVSELNRELFGNRHGIFDVVLMIIFLIFSSAMFAGLGELGETFLFKGAKFFVILISAIFAYFVLLGGFKSLKLINGLLVPLILIMIVLCCGVELKSGDGVLDTFFVSHSFLAFFTPIIYACQGLSVSYYIMIKAGNGLTKKQINLISFICASIFCLIIGLAIVVFQYNCTLINEVMPFVAIAIKLGFPFDILYFFVIVSAIATTLFSATKSFNDVVFKFTKKKKTSALITCLSALVLSMFGFDKIIEYLYPIIGCLGFLILSTIIISKVVKNKRVNHNVF